MLGDIKRKIGGLRHEHKRYLKRLVYLPSSAFDRLSGRNQMMPPRWLMFDSQTDFESVGNHLLDLCKEFGHLSPDDHVLDIGCGVGRLAIPMAKFLSQQSRYEGFDVDGLAIDWCKKNISAQWSNCGFTHVEVVNEHYNRQGSGDASNFRFPYDNASFDFAVATSLFTHLVSRDATQYLQEVGRVLKPGGRAVITWYVCDEKCSAYTEGGLAFEHVVDEHSFTANPGNPCAAIAFTRKFIVDTCTDAGLEVEADIRPGSWRGEGPTYQDLLAVSKPQ